MAMTVKLPKLERSYDDVNWTKARCAGSDRELFFSDDDELQLYAVETYCNLCPIRVECLNWALEVPEKDGIWGGMRDVDREKLLSKRKRVRCPGCRSYDVIKGAFDERLELCSACGLSWQV